jgi:hypothetical protein
MLDAGFWMLEDLKLETRNLKLCPVLLVRVNIAAVVGPLDWKGILYVQYMIALRY